MGLRSNLKRPDNDQIADDGKKILQNLSAWREREIEYGCQNYATSNELICH